MGSRFKTSGNRCGEIEDVPLGREARVSRAVTPPEDPGAETWALASECIHTPSWTRAWSRCPS